MVKEKKKILFVDDEPDQVMMISLRLKKSGYQVVSAMSGEEGVAMAVEEKPNLVLLDMLMPDIDGFEVCHRLRMNPATKDIPIISTTAAGEDDIESQCRAAGADDCIRKPYDSADLLEKISRLLEN